MHSSPIVNKVSVDLVGSALTSVITLNEGDDTELQFAFYVFRNDEKVHATRYSKHPRLEFETQGLSGYYRVTGFVKREGGSIEQVRSAPLFAHPLEVTIDSLPLADERQVAYLLKGPSWDFPALYYPGEGQTLFVMMPSATERTKTVLPAFNRWTWASAGVFPGSVLCIADPTLALDDQLRLGWLLGNKRHCATTELAAFISRLAKSKGIPPERIVIYGSSAGGFAALALAACIEGSVAVAINAQTDALSYEIAREVALIRKRCFDDMPEDAIRREFSHRVDMAARWRDVQKSRAFLVQNELDIHHYDVHFKPLWHALGGQLTPGVSSCGRHSAWVYRQEGGHISETMDMARKVVSMLGL